MNQARLIHPKIHNRRLTEFLASLPLETRELLLKCRLSLINDALFISPQLGDDSNGNEARLKRRDIWQVMPAFKLRFLYIWLRDDWWREYDINTCTKPSIFDEYIGNDGVE